MKKFFTVLFSALIISTSSVYAEWTYENSYNVLHVFKNSDKNGTLENIRFSTTSKIFIELRSDDNNDIDELINVLAKSQFQASYVPYKFPALEVNLFRDGSKSTDALVDALDTYEKFEPASIIDELKSKLREAALRTKLIFPNEY